MRGALLFAPALAERRLMPVFECELGAANAVVVSAADVQISDALTAMTTLLLQMVDLILLVRLDDEHFEFSVLLLRDFLLLRRLLLRRR